MTFNKIPSRILVLDRKTKRYKRTALSRAAAKALNRLFEDQVILMKFNRLLKKVR
jgi:hypothetical protein